jgi:UDP-2-acetamido-3-amino-2,3-dideoxy-glucuronate N-acetyltransferase
MSAAIHATAVVDPGAEIGARTKVWHFCHVMAGARIGAGCVLGQNVFVGGAVVIGDNCKIENNVSIFDGVELEADVFVGPSVVFTNVKAPRAFISRKAEFQSTKVGRGASIGANATIVCGCTLGAYCLVSAGAVVTRDVPPFALVAGVPARRHGWVCHCGTTLMSSSPSGLAPASSLRAQRGNALCPACGRTFCVSDSDDGIAPLSGLVSTD